MLLRDHSENITGAFERSAQISPFIGGGGAGFTNLLMVDPDFAKY